ncbi:hypothetical protein QTP88_024504 [Uroleucon formosanum]
MAYTTGTTTTLVSKTGHRAAALAHSVPAGDAQHVRPDRLLYSEKRKQFDRKRVGCLKIRFSFYSSDVLEFRNWSTNLLWSNVEELKEKGIRDARLNVMTSESLQLLTIGSSNTYVVTPNDS